ncbi:MAG: hypothetical protein AAFO82_01085 [Bacteroidota bacterium]
MKLLKNNIPFLLALLPQILFSNYMLVLITTIGIGFLGAWLIEGNRVFLKMLVLQLVFFSILFLLKKDNILYLDQVIQNLELPSVIVPILFILFNTLNIAILFFFGYKFQRLLFKNANLTVA